MKNNLKVERAKNNLTQADLAKLVGVSRQSINAIETKKYIPSTLLALRLARVLNVNIEHLFEMEANE